MSVGTRIKELRVEKGWSQAQLAEKAGISQPTVSLYETDTNRDHRVDVLFRIAGALSASPDYIKYGRGPKSVKDLKGSIKELHEIAADCSDAELAMLVSIAKTIKAGK